MRRGEAGQREAREIGRSDQADERRTKAFYIGAKRNESALNAVACEQNTGGDQKRDELS